MPRSVTVANLLDDLADVTEEDAFGANTYITQTRAIRYLSQSVHAFSQLTLASDLLGKTDTFVTAPGTTTYALPTDFAAMVNMFFPVQGQPCRLYRADINQIDEKNSTYGGWMRDRALYAIIGEQLIVTDPKGVFTVSRRYIPELPMQNSVGTPIADFSVTTDVLLCKGGVERWVVLDSAIKVYQKQQKDISMLVSMRNEIEAVLKPNILDRDIHENPRVRNGWDGPTTGDGREGPW